MIKLDKIGGGMKELAVLVADDDSAIFVLIARMFSHFEAKIDYAASASEAIDSLKTREYKAMLTNVDMRGMGGLELARWARDLSSTLNIVLYAGHTHEQLLKLVLDPKVLDISDGHLKPYSLGDMLQGVMTTETGKTYLLE